MHENFLIAFLFTVFAGLSTGIGSMIAFFARRGNKKFLSLALGFSAGVMIYISFVEILGKGQDYLIGYYGMKLGSIAAAAAFFGGMIFIAIISKLIPEKSAYDLEKLEKMCEGSPDKEECIRRKISEKKLMRSGMLAAISLTIHNFPEGLVSLLSALENPTMAIPVVIAIAIHNIPEGIAISAPIYYATGSKKKAFLYSLLSGMTEPIGALIGYFILMPFMNNALFGIIFAMIAGVMVFISLDELLPSAREYGSQSFSIYGMLAGMAVIAISLLLFI